MKKFYKWTLPSECRLLTHRVAGPDRSVMRCRTIDFEWASFDIRGGVIEGITVSDRYSWDGCSPSIKLLGRKLGTYDGKKIDMLHLMRQHGVKRLPARKVFLPGTVQQLYYASLIHDVLCQYSDQLKGHTTMTQKDYDQIFLTYCQQADFKFSNLYYYGVRAFQSIKSLFN